AARPLAASLCRRGDGVLPPYAGDGRAPSYGRARNGAPRSRGARILRVADRPRAARGRAVWRRLLLPRHLGASAGPGYHHAIGEAAAGAQRFARAPGPGAL